MSKRKFVLLFTIFVDATGYAMIFPFISYYALSFNVGAFAIGLLMNIFALMQFISSPIMGRLSDKYGRRNLLMLSILVSGFSFVLFATAISYWMLFFSRILSGAATEISIAQAYMADITSNKKRTSGLGKVRAAFSGGVIIGPALGGFLSIFGYWAPGFLATILTLINLVFVYFFLPETVEKNKFNGNRDHPIQSRKDGFLINLKKAFQKPLLPFLLIILFIMNLAFSAIPVLIPLITKKFFNFDNFSLAWVFVFIGALQFVIQGFLMDFLSEKVGEGRLIIFGLLFILLGIVLIPILPIVTFFFILIGFLSTGSGFIRTSIPGVISKISKEDEQGGFMGLAQSIASLALIPGPLIAGFFYEFLSLYSPFIISAVIISFGLILSIKVYVELNKDNICVKRKNI
ncbi:MAG: MFS transporter [Candidatus Lokiarchaeota archaeon]